MRTSPINFDLLGGNGYTLKGRRKENKTTNKPRHGPRPMANLCHFPDSTCFSLQTTCKVTIFGKVRKRTHVPHVREFRHKKVAGIGIGAE